MVRAVRKPLRASRDIGKLASRVLMSVARN